MINKFSISGYAPTLITSVNARRFLNIQNFGPAAIYISMDGSNSVTTLTGVNPGIIIPSGNAYQMDQATVNDWTQANKVFGVVDGTGVNTIVVQEF